MCILEVSPRCHKNLGGFTFSSSPLLCLSSTFWSLPIPLCSPQVRTAQFHDCTIYKAHVMENREKNKQLGTHPALLEGQQQQMLGEASLLQRFSSGSFPLQATSTTPISQLPGGQGARTKNRKNRDFPSLFLHFCFLVFEPNQRVSAGLSLSAPQGSNLVFQLYPIQAGDYPRKHGKFTASLLVLRILEASFDLPAVFYFSEFSDCCLFILFQVYNWYSERWEDETVFTPSCLELDLENLFSYLLFS